MQLLLLLLDVVLGVVLAGLVVPILVAARPEVVRGRTGFLLVVVACIVAISAFRHLFVTTSGTREDDGK